VRPANLRVGEKRRDGPLAVFRQSADSKSFFSCLMQIHIGALFMGSSFARRGASPEMIPKVERGVACRGGDS
jgi:hypothetical protein